jgi:O-antigen/teichoic acid export membrane protein
MSTIKKNFIYNILLSVTQVLFPLITFSYVARVILPDGVGLVSFVESICRYAMLIAALGIPIYGIREVAKFKDDKIKLGNLCSELVLIHMITTIFIIIVYCLMIFMVDKFYQNLSFYLVGISMILSNVFVIEWYFQGIGDFKYITGRTVIIRTLTTVLVFFLVKNSQDSIYFFLLTILTTVLNGFINFWHAKKSLSFNFKIKLSSLKKHLKPLFYIFSTTLSISVYILLDTVMLGFLSDEKAVGFYSMAMRIGRVPMLLVGSLGAVLIPQLAFNYAQNNMQEFSRLISKSINFVITFSFPVIFLVLGVSKELIVVFAGDKFIEASHTLQITSVVVFLIGMSNIFGLQILTPMAKDKYLTYSVLVGTFISVLLNYILIPSFQANGAAVSYIVTEAVVAGMTFYFASKFISMNIDCFFIIKTLLFCIPIYFIPMFLHYFIISNFVVLLATGVLAGIYYLGIQVYVIKNEIIIELTNKIKLKL